MTDQEATINEQSHTITMLRAVVEKRIAAVSLEGAMPDYLLATYAVLTDIYHNDPEAANFLGLGWTVYNDDGTEDHYSAIVQRTNGESPASLAVRMKRENAALMAEVDAAQKTIQHYQEALRTPLGTDTGPNGVRELQRGIDYLEKERDALQSELDALKASK